ncbi:hypothetical protein BHE74_00021870 [Ensete ventricosum]|nr:hypothetical protein BHE74_00021870 [Ensete ventricosum]
MARLSPHPFDSLRIGLLQTKLEQTAYSIKLAPIPSGDIKRSHSDAQPLPHICHVRWIHSHHNPPSLSPSKAAAAVRHTRSRVDLVAGDGRRQLSHRGLGITRSQQIVCELKLLAPLLVSPHVVTMVSCLGVSQHWGEATLFACGATVEASPDSEDLGVGSQRGFEVRGFSLATGGVNRSEAMEAEDLRRWMRSTGVDLWALIDTAISVAAGEHRQELRSRRDGIVQRLYAAGDAGRCRNCGSSGGGSVVPRREEAKGSSSSAEKRAAVGAASPPSPESMNRTAAAAAEEEEEDDDQRTYGRSIDEEQSKILGIKQFLDDPDQVCRFAAFSRKPQRKHRILISYLMHRKWKDLVDEWVTSNSAFDTASPAIISKKKKLVLFSPYHSKCIYLTNEKLALQLMETRHSRSPERTTRTGTKYDELPTSSM